MGSAIVLSFLALFMISNSLNQYVWFIFLLIMGLNLGEDVPGAIELGERVEVRIVGANRVIFHVNAHHRRRRRYCDHVESRFETKEENDGKESKEPDYDKDEDQLEERQEEEAGEQETTNQVL
jgi:hypothetical protein